ncbi:MAG TPA: hypothetical protein VIK89_08865 [Cytophagaceae bacterium]
MEPYVKNMMLKHTVKVWKLQRIDGAGDRIYSEEPIEMFGYFVGQTSLIMTGAGEQKLSSGYIILDAEDFKQVSVGDLIETNDTPGKLPVIHVRPYYRYSGILDYGLVFLK